MREGAEEAEAKDGDAGARGELAELMEFIGGCCAFVGAAVEGDQNTGIGGWECAVAGDGGEPAGFQVCVPSGLPGGRGMEDMGGQERAGRRRGEDDSGLTGEENDGEEVPGGERLTDLEGEGAEAGNSGGAH